MNIRSWNAYRCRAVLRNLVVASNLPLSNVRQFLYSKPSYTKFYLATRKFKTMKAFARFKNEIWCMDLAYVDEVPEDKNGVRYLLVRQDLLDSTLDKKRMQTKASKETVRAVSIITKKNRPTKILTDKETELAGGSEKLRKAEGIQSYSTMKETRAVFAERTKRSLKKILYHYMEDYRYR